MIKVNGKEIEFTQFPNGETNMSHLSFPALEEGEPIKVTFKYESDGDLIKLLFVRGYLEDFFVERDMVHDMSMSEIYLEMYHAPYGRMDRSENGTPFTLSYVADFINRMGFDGVSIIEPHSDVSLKLIDNSVPDYVTKYLYPDVFKDIDFNIETDYVMFPDKGASTRYSDILFPNVLIGEKVRNFGTGRIESLDVVGRVDHTPNKVLIMDDLSSFGGTFCRASEKLREMGFKEVYLLVAHAEDSVFKGKLFDNIDKLFTTDSMLTEQDYWSNKKFESRLKIYKLENLL